MNTMNKNVVDHRLTIEFGGEEGAFLRILGLMERRAYHLQSCALKRRPDDSCTVDVVVESDRAGDLLKRQLERLHNVNAVTLHVPAKPQTTAPPINIHTQTYVET
jgi:acetolactate synthase regulatory subunit